MQRIATIFMLLILLTPLSGAGTSTVSHNIIAGSKQTIMPLLVNVNDPLGSCTGVNLQNRYIRDLSGESATI
jgi:hypothetical protein